MPVTRTPRRTAGRPTAVAPTPDSDRGTHASGTAPMLALQRAAGNASALALLRRARKIEEEPPVALTLAGLVNGAAVSSWSLDRDTRGRPTGLEMTRPLDDNSPIFAKALVAGAPGVDGTLVVRRLTPLGWVRRLTVTMADCAVDQYMVDEGYESVHLVFSRVQVDQ
jgi:hypothetical protein